MDESSGLGGQGVSGTPGITLYNTVDMPLIPGSAGGRGAVSWPSSLGGRVVRIQAQNLVMVNGSILANGEDVSASSPSGGGSGGGIWIQCKTFAGNTNGFLSARGGNTSTAASWAGGSGGGGRIAVWRRRHEFQGSATATNGISWPGCGGTEGTVLWVDVPNSGIIIAFH